MSVIFVLLLSLNLRAAYLAETWSRGGQGSGKQRSLQQNFAQFSPLQDQSQTFGPAGGTWGYTIPGQRPVGPAAAPLNGQPAGVQNGNNGVRPTTVPFSGNLPQQTTPGVVMPGGQLPTSSGTRREIGKFGAVTHIKPVTIIHRTGGVSRVALGTTGTTGGAVSNTAPGSNTVAPGTSNPAVGVDVGVTVPAAQRDNIVADITRSAGIINGATPPNLDLNPAAAKALPVFVSRKGVIVTQGDPATWPSINPESRINAVFLPDKHNASGTIPGPEAVIVEEPNPMNVTMLPAASFESGYCVPRVAFLVVNVTSHSCSPGSNLTTWDGEPVCAKMDCRWRAIGTNVLASGTGCRTVVERATPNCPRGCVIIEQLRWNTTTNRTQVFTKCSCKAGSQPCPQYWTACTCYQGFSLQNLTKGFVVCSETQEECDRKCNLAVSGNPRRAPLCPVIMDPFLSLTPTGAPIYPTFGWNINTQARQTAVLGAATTGRNLKQLIGFSRRLTMAAADWQLHRLLGLGPSVPVLQGNLRAAPGSTAAQAVPVPGQQLWLARVCEGVNWVREWLGRSLLQGLRPGQHELRL